MTMTPCELVTYLSEGLTSKDISELESLGKKAVEKRIEKLKKSSSAKNTTHLVGLYFRKNLIK